MQPIFRFDRHVLLGSFAVDEHVHVRSDGALFVEHPPGGPRVLTLQRTQHLYHGDAVEPDLAPPSGEVLQGCAQGDKRHEGGV